MSLGASDSRMRPLAAVWGLIILVAACSDASSVTASEPMESQTASTPQVAAPNALTMPAVEAGKMPGVLSGSIGGDALSLSGTCSMGPHIFEFWSDGKEFAVNRDTNGDNVSLNIMIRPMTSGGKTMAVLTYRKDGKMVYNGLFDPSSYDGTILSADTALGRAAAISAKFEVNCNK